MDVFTIETSHGGRNKLFHAAIISSIRRKICREKIECGEK
jgi:hypothetical protein